MKKVAPNEVPGELENLHEVRRALTATLDKLDNGRVCCVPPSELIILRSVVAEKLASLPEAPESGERLVAKGEPESVTLPISVRSRGNAVELSFSEETAQLLEGYYPRSEWGAHRSSVAILAALIEESGRSPNVPVSIDRLSEITGYSTSTIKTEIGVVRTMRGLDIPFSKGKYRFLGRRTNPDSPVRSGF